MYNLVFIEIFATAMIVPAVMAYMEFFYFIATDKRLMRWGAVVVESIILVLPPVLLYFSDAGDSEGNYTIIFPSYRPIIYTLILLCIVVYFYAMWRQRLSHPLWEIIIGCTLLLGVALNILMVLRMQDPFTLFFLNLPATLLLILALVRNHRLLLYTLEDLDADVLEPAPKGWLSRVCWYVLRRAAIVRMAVLAALSLPALIPLAKIFLYTGQMH